MYNGIVKEENPYERLTKRKRLMDLFKKKAPATAEEKAKAEAETIEDAKKLEKKVVKSEKGVRHYQNFIIRLVAFILVIWVLFFKIVGITHMPNNDMYPRLDAGDMLLFYRLDKDVHSQDIIVLEKITPQSNNKREVFVGRVVAKGGDTVDLTKEGRLVVNGNTVIEPNIFYDTPRYEGFTTFPITLQQDECFVLSDSRDGGTDSRFYGPVKKSEIVGTVITVLRRNNL